MRLLLLASLVFATTALGSPQLDSRILSKLSPKLKQALRSKHDEEEPFNVFVEFNVSTSSVLEQVATTSYPNRTAKITAMRQMLLDLAARSQTEAIEMAAARGVEHKSFWISNQLFVKSADFDTILELAFKDEVEYIQEEQITYLEKSVSSRSLTLNTVDDYTWGIKKIQAPAAWKALGNNDGRGVVVATIDTGVRGTHEALKDNFFGPYGWFDPYTAEPFPTDPDGHGTHVTGTIAGRRGIGVAPGSKWMACIGCGIFSCPQSWLNSCGQFFTCPTLADGSAPDCSKAPHIVSNSWGGGRGATWFNPVIEAWRAGGIIPVFSIGNSGPNCDTAHSAGDSAKVIGVGATTEYDFISSSSSRGPTWDGRIKPDISAPGTNVKSASHTADDEYVNFAGTSMACPHVAGAIALLLTRHPGASFDKVRDLLVENAERNLSFSGEVCGGIPDNQFPNHVFGTGRLNILKSVTAGVKPCGANQKERRKPRKGSPKL